MEGETMSLERIVKYENLEFTVHNRGYNYTTVIHSAGGPFGPVVLLTIPNDAMTEFVAALLDVQEDSHATDGNRHND